MSISVYTRRAEGFSTLVYTCWLAPGYGVRYRKLEDVPAEWREEARLKAERLARSRSGLIRKAGLKHWPWIVDVIIKEKSNVNQEPRRVPENA